jgi:hypothetical protein
MSSMSMILGALMAFAVLVYIAPSVFALNRGHVLRNVALWLAIFLGLALVYQNFGPGSPHPLFSTPDAMKDMRQEPLAPAAEKTAPDSVQDKAKAPEAVKNTAKDQEKDDAKDGDEGEDAGFTPPAE